jgi:predicted nucleic acid-binding protein
LAPLPPDTAVFLDTGPLGTVSNPKSSSEGDACKAWLQGLVARGTRVLVPEIGDYEVRRELLRAGKTAGLARLDVVKAALEYLPITTEAMLLAADLWAQVRRQGQPTADAKSLDGDVILAAQALTLGLPADRIVIATVNVGHFARFIAAARRWQDIT